MAHRWFWNEPSANPRRMWIIRRCRVFLKRQVDEPRELARPVGRRAGICG
jgi:hypothetical protein